jgi:outer membrane protein assembly factor BamB
MNGMVANGVLYMAGLGGDVYAFNVLTGTFLWHYSTGTAGYNTPYGIWPIWDQGLNGFSIAGGLLFVAEGHEYSPPLFLGASQLALNLTNGNPVWSIEAFDVNDATAISDGIMTTLNAYDAQIYAYGQGPSKTTVTAPDIDVTTSKPVTITGTVMDISAGSLQK